MSVKGATHGVDHKEGGRVTDPKTGWMIGWDEALGAASAADLRGTGA